MEQTKRSNEYRRRVSDCMDLARRMSLDADRARLVEMASDWLELAVQAENGKDVG